MGVADAIAFAQAQIGKPYVFGATGPNAYDCSGLAQAACKAGGVNIARVTYDQLFDGTEVTRDALAPGDLLFPDAGHVQLYVGNNQVIEAPHSGAFVRQVAVWGFWRARRVFDAVSATTPTGFLPVLDNPLDPNTYLKKFPVLAELEKIGVALSSATFWKRLGVGMLGLLIILLGVAFVNRRRIQDAATSGAKAVGVAALV